MNTDDLNHLYEEAKQGNGPTFEVLGESFKVIRKSVWNDDGDLDEDDNLNGAGQALNGYGENYEDAEVDSAIILDTQQDRDEAYATLTHEIAHLVLGKRKQDNTLNQEALAWTFENEYARQHEQIAETHPPTYGYIDWGPALPYFVNQWAEPFREVAESKGSLEALDMASEAISQDSSYIDKAKMFLGMNPYVDEFKRMADT